MEDFGFDLEQIARLVRLVETRGLEELVIEEGGRSIVIRGAGEAHSRVEPPVARAAEAVKPSHAAAAACEAARASEAPAATPEDWVAVEAPTVGVFYRAGRPDDPPLVEVGDHVQVGQAIGILEAMKVFSEIPSEVSGIVVEIAAKNGQLVRPGEAIMYLRAE